MPVTNLIQQSVIQGLTRKGSNVVNTHIKFIAFCLKDVTSSTTLAMLLKNQDFQTSFAEDGCA